MNATWNHCSMFLQIMYPACTKLIHHVLPAPAPLLKTFICSDIYSEPSFLEHGSNFLYVSLHIFPLHPWMLFMEADFCANQNPELVLWRPLGSLSSNHFRHLSSRVCSATRHYSGLWEFLGHLCYAAALLTVPNGVSCSVLLHCPLMFWMYFAYPESYRKYFLIQTSKSYHVEYLWIIEWVGLEKL